MPTVHLGVAGGADLSNAISGLGTQLDALTNKQRTNTTATRAQAQASTAAASGFQTFSQSAQQSVQRIQGVAGAIQGLVSQLGSHNRTAGLIASVAGATAQFASMGSMLGPAGTVIGGLAGLVVGLRGVTSEMNDIEGAARAAAEEIHNLAQARIAERAEARISAGLLSGSGLGGVSEGDLATRSEEARIRAGRAAEEIARRTGELGAVWRGSHGLTAPALTGSDREAAEAALATARATLAAQNAIIDSVRRETEARADAVREAEHMAELQRREAELLAGEERERREAAEETAALDARNRRERERRGGGSSGPDPLRGAASAADIAAIGAEFEALSEARLEALDEEILERIERRAETVAAEKEMEQALLDAEAVKADAMKESAEHHLELLRDTGNAAKEFSTGYVSSLDAVIASWRQLEEASRASGTAMMSDSRLAERSLVATGNTITETIGGKMTSALGSAVGAWLDGSKSIVEAAEEAAKGVIKALVQEAIVQTIVEGARSIASFASQDYAGGIAHATAAGAWAAVGIVAGGIGAATGSFGGGGKGSGVSARETADSDRERERDRNAGPQVINIYADGLPTTRNDFAAGLTRGLRDARRAGYLPAGAFGG